MKQLLFRTSLAILVMLPMAVHADPATTKPAHTPLTLPTDADYTWEGKIDFLRPQQEEIVVNDKMYKFSTTTLITKRGKNDPVSAQELRVGQVVKVTPRLPVPLYETPFAVQIEIIR